MYTLVTKKSEENLNKISKTYMIISAFCMIFSAVYEYFSHGVYSMFMIFAFAIPFLLGTVVFHIINLFAKENMPSSMPVNLYNSGVATLTVGSIFQGVLEIYGTTNELVKVYLIVGLLLVILGVLGYAIGLSRNEYI